MSHLSPERIAALVDESPTAAELVHLVSCADCTHERGRFESVAELAKSAPAINVPLTSWERLAPALRANGIMVGAAPVSQARSTHRGWMQAAAAMLLVVGGMMAGRVSAGAALLPTAFLGDSAQAPTFASVEDAEQARRKADLVSRAAMMYLSSASLRSATPRMLSSRAAGLASLDATLEALSRDLHDAPKDPVLSSIRETTKAQYAATVEQMNMVRPASLTNTAY